MKGPPVDATALEKLRRIAPTYLEAHRDRGTTDWRPACSPNEVAFKLTSRCDLRCSHCYQWGEGGHHHQLEAEERQRDLPLALIARVFEATRAPLANVYLWGGEPLLYREWEGLISLLEREQRWTTLCTNGTLLKHRLPSLARLGDRLEISVSIDGLEATHDALRGEGTFARTMGGVRALVSHKKTGAWCGSLSVNCVITEPLVGRLEEVVRFFEGEGVETLYLSLPWFLSEAAANEMDRYCDAHLPGLGGPAPSRSWRSYSHRLPVAHLETLSAELARLQSLRTSVKLRLNPAVDAAELKDFLLGSGTPAQGKRRCLALKSRMDVFPNGDVVSCKFFPEFAVGNLEASGVDQVWRGAAYDRVRATVAQAGLMPVCAKCPLLYSRGA